MTIDEFVKSIGFDDATMEVLGELKNFKYYIRSNPPEDREVGIPLVVVENKKKHTFEVCDDKLTFDVIKLFSEEK